MQFVADFGNRTRFYTKTTRQNTTGEDCLHRLYAARLFIGYVRFSCLFVNYLPVTDFKRGL